MTLYTSPSLTWAQAAAGTQDMEVPWIFLCVFGIPLFATLVYLMMQLTRPDRGGRIDVEVLDKLAKEPTDEEPTSA